MRINKLFIVILLGIVIVISSCSGEAEQEIKSIAEEGLNITETLEGSYIQTKLLI